MSSYKGDTLASLSTNLRVFGSVMGEPVVFLENCDHWVQEERPDAVNRELIEFIRRELRHRES